MAIKTFEREVKKLTQEFTNLIEEYNFDQYDFHSIRQTLMDYIEKTYPDYNDYFRSDYIMMLIELFAFYGEMMAYRMDVNMNEVYLSSAKDRRSIIKIADMLGYKYNRIIPSTSISKFDITDSQSGNFLVKKIREQTSTDDILNKTYNIRFEALSSTENAYYPYKLDYLLKNITAEQFIQTIETIFVKLENFDYTENIKVKKVIEDGFETYERSIFVDKFQTRLETNFNVMVEYIGKTRTFEVENIKFDPIIYMNSERTEDAITYDEASLYSDTLEVGFEFILRYDKGYNIIDKEIYMYMPIIQGATFTRPLEINKVVKNHRIVLYEQNVFQNNTIIKQFDDQDNTLRTYYEVENINNSPFKYAYEVNNTENGHIELIFGDGRNVEPLLPTATTLFYYRKNPFNTDEVLNVKNGKILNFVINSQYYDANIGESKNYMFNLLPYGKFNATGGLAEEDNDQIKYMAKKIRSVQDRFVTAKDYETAGMLHPRVKYASVVLRTYIGKNSPRLDNQFIEIYIDQNKSKVNLIELFMDDHYDYYLEIPNAYFTISSVADKFDTITFISDSKTYFFEIFDIDAISPNEWFKFPSSFLLPQSKGTVIKLLNRYITDDELSDILNISKINSILPFDYTITNIVCLGITPTNISFKITSKNIYSDTYFEDYLKKSKELLLTRLNSLFNNTIVITNVKFVPNINDYSMVLIYETRDFKFPDEKSIVWTHYKSDDIYLNPSKSNIIEIYVSGYKNNLKENIEEFAPLNSTEINALVKEIDQRKMMSDIVQVYNASVYEVEIAIKVFKSHTYAITDELLTNKINKSLNNFFDVRNLPLGKHFHMSKLIEWLHKEIPEIQHIEMLLDENNIQITPSSTMDILMDKVLFTQIVEKSVIVNDKRKPMRRIEIA